MSRKPGKDDCDVSGRSGEHQNESSKHYKIDYCSVLQIEGYTT